MSILISVIRVLMDDGGHSVWEEEEEEEPRGAEGRRGAHTSGCPGGASCFLSMMDD